MLATIQSMPPAAGRTVKRTLLILSYICLLCGLGTSRVALAEEANEIDLAQTQSTFLADPDFRQNLKRLMELEQQALALIEDEPLKMGSLGSAILDLYPASQTGHLAMQSYYEYLDAEEAQQSHATRLAHIHEHMQKLGDGQPATPFPIMTVHDAHAFARHHDLSPVGAIYQSSEDATFGYLLIAKPAHAKLRQIFFDVSHLLTGLGLEDADHTEHGPNPWAVIRILAAGADDAAQTAIGAYLSNVKKYDDAISWLKVASRTGNILANTLLARIYWTQSTSEEDADKKGELKQLAEENYLTAVALGSTDAMYSLANLYFAGELPGGERESALPLLEQAGELGHAESLIYLAHLYNTGLYIGEEAKDQDRARDYFQRAVALNHPTAILSYGRFLVAERQAAAPDEPVFEALEEMARADDTDAMIVLANLHARKLAPKASRRTAIRWYKRAAKAKPEDADVVNEVAWTLTVSDVPGLQQTRYAKRIMDKLMERSPAAMERPEYLDTWAATHAANGDFAAAIELQNKAITVAEQAGREDVLNILREHLQKFQAESVIVEAAP